MNPNSIDTKSEVFMGVKPITVLVVDDHALIHEAIRSRLDDHDDIKIVAEGMVGEQVLPLVARHRPDIVLLDLRMPQRAGDRDSSAFPFLEVIARLSQMYPETRVIILSQYAIPGEVQEIMRRGARGYVLKGDILSLRLAEAIKSVHAGHSFFSRAVQQILFEAPRSDRVAMLTARQQEVWLIKMRNLDKPNAELAALLHISESAFKGHLTNAYRTLEVKNTAEAVAYYAQMQQPPLM